MEILCPVCIVRGYPCGKSLNTVGSVPLGQFVQIVVDRVIVLYLIRINIPAYIFIPRFQPLQQCILSHRVDDILGKVAKRQFTTVARPILHHPREHIATHLVAIFHKRLCLEREQNLRSKMAEGFAGNKLLLISIVKHHADELCVTAQIRMSESAVDTHFLRQSIIKTIAGQQMESIIDSLLLRFIEVSLNSLTEIVFKLEPLRLQQVITRKQTPVILSQLPFLINRSTKRLFGDKELLGIGIKIDLRVGTYLTASLKRGNADVNVCIKLGSVIF